MLLSPIAVCLIACVGLSTDFWVDGRNGNDAGDGTEASPFQTITHALSLARSGDRVWVRPAYYTTTIGEDFPLEIRAGVELRSTDGPEVTFIRGNQGAWVVKCLNQPEGAPNVIEGFTVQLGETGITSTGSWAQTLLLNNTITQFNGTGLFVNTRHGTFVLLENRFHENGHGARISSGRPGRVPILSQGNRFTNNEGIGLIVFSQAPGDVISENDVFSGNGNRGIEVGALPDRTGGAILRNATITRNGWAGAQVWATRYCYYYPPIPPFCWSSYGQLRIESSLICDNGRYGVIEYSNYGPPVGSLESSIVWGNGFDNTGFENANSVIGTSDTPLGPGSFSKDPRFVDPERGDYRLRPDSPCIDHHAVTLESLDFEGELRPFDGDGDGRALADIGPDELHTYVAPASVPVASKPFRFIVRADPGDNGLLALVFVSASRAHGRGICLPGDPAHRSVDLENDSVFQVGLRLQHTLTASIKDGRGQTGAVWLPPELFALGGLYYAAVTVDVGRGRFRSVTPSRRLGLD